MKRGVIVLIMCVLFAFLTQKSGRSCTCFCLDRGAAPFLGKNYDWMVGDGLVIINKRRVSKTGIPSRGQESSWPAMWTSRYGSVTFNQYGREVPAGGMNEAGLVVEVLLLEEAEYPLPDARPGISPSQWRQYQLDNSATVEEVIASDSRIRIRPSGAPGCHFFVCDRSGDCAVIEFVGGKLVPYSKGTMPVKALTNSVYAESINFWKQGRLPVFDQYRSVDRFVRAADMVKNYHGKKSGLAIDYAFGILKGLAQGSFTQWSIVYDIENLKVYFRTCANHKIRYLDLKSFDFSCARPVKVLDMNADLSGEVTGNFIDYTYRINRDLIGNAFRKTYFLADLPEEELDRLARYPGSTVCVREPGH